jgi:hypothetical protein
MGVVCTFLVFRPRKTKHEEPSATADDDCQSLYYDSNLGSEGSGLPETRTCDIKVIDSLFSVKHEAKFLDKEFYNNAVDLLPTVCVDIIVQRKLDNKVLLLFRRDKPVAGVWWWVGGRAFKGESFFQTAIRKTAAETGKLPPQPLQYDFPIPCRIFKRTTKKIPQGTTETYFISYPPLVALFMPFLGVSPALIFPKGLVHVWNTFFPDR